MKSKSLTGVATTLSYIFNSQEGSQKRTRVSLEDMAVTPTLFADLEKKTSSPASVLLASMVMAAHVMVRIPCDIIKI